MTAIHRALVKNIRATAKRRKIAISHLPDRADISRGHFFNVLRGRASPTLDWISRVARALHVDAKDLLL